MVLVLLDVRMMQLLNLGLLSIGSATNTKSAHMSIEDEDHYEIM